MRYNQLSNERILSIDAFRGITILVMIFVNELAGVHDIPQWMKHMPRDADAMSFVDVVFPGFLFIVGMSIPFAINRRLEKGASFIQLQQHILFRTLGLLVLGFFMVNAEGGYDEKAMGISINLWSILFFAAVLLIWKVYRTSNKILVYTLKGDWIYHIDHSCFYLSRTKWRAYYTPLVGHFGIDRVGLFVFLYFLSIICRQ